MVAIVAGSGLGLLNTSLNIIGEAGVLGQSLLGQANSRAFVNAVTGNLVLQMQDEQLTGRGLDHYALRTYNSLGGPDDGDADGWRWSYEQTVRFLGPGTPPQPHAGAEVIRTDGEGHATTFSWDAARTAYVGTEGGGAHDELRYDSASSEWQWTDGSTRVVERYSNSTSSGMTGRLIRRSDTSGNSIALSYDGGRLTLIRDIASQQEMRLVYGLFHGVTRVRRLETRALVEDASGSPTATLGDPVRQVEYDYDSSGRLITVTRTLTPADGTVFVTTYAYDGTASRIATVTMSDGTGVSFTYDLAGRVSRVADRSGAADAQLVLSFSPATHSTDITDGNGQVWTYRYDATTEQLTEIRTPAVDGARLSTRFAYDGSGNLVGLTDARTNAVTYRYNGSGNRLLERDALGNTVTRTFSASNQTLTQTRYRIPDTDGAGPTSANDPLTSRYAYDATSRLRFVVSPEGRVTENRYESYGLLTHTLQYTGQVYDITGLGPAEPLAEEQLTAWVDDLPDEAQAQLTEYGYDLRGNLNRQTSYATGVGVLDDQASVTEYRYDAHGRLLRRTAVRGSARDERFVVASFAYDGMGRVVTGTDATGTQTIDYDDAHGRITVTATSGPTEMRSYDGRGRLVRVRRTGGPTTAERRTRQVYDNADRLRMTEDAQGGRRYRFYDAAGRLEFSVDATGAVTRSERDGTGQVVRQTQYQNRADSSGWYDSATQTVTKLGLTVGSDVHTDPVHDRVTTFEYDAAGRLIRTTDAAGTVTTTRYDGASRVTMTQTGDRATRYIYDRDDRRVGVVDPLGHLTEQGYDAAGRLIETVRYSRRSPAAPNLSAPVWIGVTQQTAIAGKPFEYRVPTSDPDGDRPIVGTVGTPPSWLSFDPGTATLRGTAPAAPGTEHQVTLRAHGRGRTADVTVRIAVTAPLPSGASGTAGPSWVSLSPLEATTDTPVSYVVPAATGPSLTYRVVSGLPVGLAFDPTTRTISGTAGSVGFSTVVLRATNAGGQSVDRTVSVRISTATTPPDQPTGSDQLSDWRPADPSALRSYLYNDGQGRVVGAVDERQFLTETEYDDARHTQRTLRYLAGVTVGPSDTLDSVRSRAGSVRQSALVQYDGFGRVLVTTGPDGSTQTRNEYDDAGRLTRVVSAAHTAEQRARRTFVNAFGEATATLGGEADASLPPNPSPEQIDEAIRDYGTRTAYDTLGRAIRTVDANGNTTLLYYDRENRPTHTIAVVGSSTNGTLAGEASETTYTSFGQAASVRRYATRVADADMDQLLTGGGGGTADQFLLSTLVASADPDLDSVTSYEYDRNGRPVEEVDGEGGVTITLYNRHGESVAQVRSLSEGRSTTQQLDYDLAGRVVSRTDDVGGINANAHTAYDAFGRITRSIDAAGNVTTSAYHDSGRTVVATDPLRRATVTEYDSFGRVRRGRNALGHQTGYGYDDDARRVTVTSPEQVHVTTARTRHGELASVTDGRGNATTYAYNRDGQQTTVTDPLSQVTTRTTYDRSGRTHDVTDARGTVTWFGYDQRNRVIERRVDPTGSNLTTLFAFDALGRQIQVTEGAHTVAARTSTYLYDRKGRRITEIMDPDGLQLSTTSGYDDRDNVVTVAHGTVSRPNQSVTRYEFDSLGRRTKEIAAPSSVFGSGAPGTRDLTTQYRYDVGGRVSCRIDANRMSTWQVYDTAGQLTHTITALGDVSENRYDAVGRPVNRRRCVARLGPSTVDGFGDIVGGGFVVPPAHANDQIGYIVYDKDGRPRFSLQATGSRGWTISENRHDANANVLETRRYDKFLPNARVTAIDSVDAPGITMSEIQGELSTLGYHDNTPSSSAGVPRTRFAYDANNRLRFSADPLGSIAETAYDPAGNVLSATRFASRPTLTEYTESAIDAAVDRTENDNSVTRSAYDAAGWLRYTVDALGSVRENEYDARGNVVTRVRWASRPKLTQYTESAITAALAALPANGDEVTHLVYDAGSRLRFTLDALGSVSENGYDAVGNVVVTTRFAGRPTAPTAYTESDIDAAVNPLRGDRANQVTRVAHDPSNRPRFTVDALGSVSEKVYDAAGNVVVTTRFATRPALHQYTESAIDTAVAPLRADDANSTNRLVYDGANRLRYTVDALGSITERAYDTVGNLSRVLRLAVRPPLTAYSEGALNKAVAPQRDNSGNQLQHSVYDAAGQVRFSLQRVSAEAGQFRYAVTRHELDALGQKTATTTYATAVPLTSFSEPAVSAAVGSGDAATDRVARVVYDLAGHQSYALSALTVEAGQRRYQVTAQQFDAFGRVVGSTTYATAVAVSAFDQASIGTAVSAVADPTRDRASAAAYDPSDQMVYDLRLLGPDRYQVVQQEYEALGRIAATTRYAQTVGPLANFDRATLDAAVGAIAGADNRKTLSVYDAAGRQRFTLQTDRVPRWTVSESRYDAVGNVIESRRYDRLVSDAWIASVDTTESPGVDEHEVLDQLAVLGYSDNTPNTLANLQRTRFAYDTSNQLRFTVDALGSVAENRYDALGRVATTARFAARPTLTEYAESAIEAAVDSDDGDNQLQHRTYNANGQPRYTVDVLEPNVGSGGRHRVTEQSYDALGQPVDSRAYATELGHLTSYDETSIAAAILPSPQRDRRSVIAYDTGGRQAYTVRDLYVGREGEAGCVVTRNVYDGLRQLVQRIDYASPVLFTQVDKEAIDGALVPDPAADRAITYVYDAGGRLRFELHPDLSFQETEYDALSQVTQALQFDFRLPSNASLTEAELVTVRGDHTVGDGVTRGQAHTYDAAGRLTSTSDALNNTERYEYNSLGDRTKWIDKNGASWTYEYDRKGQRITEASPPVQFTLDGEPLNTAGALRVIKTSSAYDAFGNLIQKIEAGNFPHDARTTNLRYDTVGRLTSTRFHGYYDATTGRVVREPAADRFRREAATVYDPLGNPVRTSIRTGVNSFRHTYRTYDRQAQVVHEVNALNNVTRYAYTPFGEPEVVTRYSVTISGAPGNGLYWIAGEVEPQLNWGYDENGNLLPDAYARPITMAYDKLGRKISVTQPTTTYYSTHTPGDPSQANYYRPNASSVIGMEDAAETRYEYNAFSDLTLQRVRSNNIVEWQDTSFGYDAMGRKTGSVDAAGHITVMVYDALGNLVRTDEPGEYSDGTARNTAFAYNALNQQTRVDRFGLRYTDAGGVDHGIAYWTWEDGGHWVDPDAEIATTVKTTTYDGHGRVLHVMDGAGNVTSTRYNALGHLISVTEPARLVAPDTANGEAAVDPFRDQVSETPVTLLMVNAFGQPVRAVRTTSQSDDARETLQTYDVADELLSTTDAEGNVTSRSYDFAGRVVTETQTINADLGPLGINNQGLERRYVYDALGQLTDTLDVYAEGNDLLQSGRSVNYNAFGEIDEERRKWGSASQSPEALNAARVTWNHYDNAGHVSEKVAADGLTVYHYNLLGQVTREEKRGDAVWPDDSPDRVTENQYDVLGRAIMTRKPEFDADITPGTGTSTRLVTPYVSRTLDRWGNLRFHEDGGYEFVNGRPVYASRIFRSYQYDDDNRLVAEYRGTHDYVTPSGVSRSAQISTLTFRDLLGHVMRQVDEARDQQTDALLSSRTRRKAYTSIGQLRAETDATGSTVEHAYGVHGDRLGTRNARGTVFFDRYDRNGSIRFSGVLRTASPAGVGEYNSFAGTGTIIRTYLSAHLYDQANRRFASKTFTEGADAPWVYTWLDGRSFGILHRDEVGIVTQCRYDQLGNKSVEIDGGGARSEWIAATDDYVVGRIARYSQPTDTGLRFGNYTYNDFGEIKIDAVGNSRTEYDRTKNGLLGVVTIIPNVLTPDVREVTSYDYDARGQLTSEVRIDSDPASASISNRYFSYDLQGRLVQVEDNNKVPFTPTSDVRYSYDEWDNIRRIRATYMRTVTEGPVQSDCWNLYADAGRMTLSNGRLTPEGVGLKLHIPGSVQVHYDSVGRRSGTTEYVRTNSTHPHTNDPFFRTWDTMRDERYDYDDLGHLRRTEQRIRHVNIVRTNASGDQESQPSQVGSWQPLSTRSANLRGDVTHADLWGRIFGAPNSLRVDQVPGHLSTTTTAYRADGQVTSTDTTADDPVNSTSISNTYSAQTGLLESYEFSGRRADQAPYTTTFVYRHTLQNGNRVVRRISDVGQGLDTAKTYDPLGRLSQEKVELPNPDGGGTDRYDERRYEYGGQGRIVLKDTRLRLSSNGPDTNDLPTPSTGQLVYVGAGNRTVAMVGGERLAEATKFDFAYTPMSEAATSGASRYVVRTGDTLIDIAQTVYGDGGLWQLIAEANSIAAAPDDELPATEVGKAYEIPSAIRSSNSATTFTPYNAAVMIGNDRPIIIPPPPPPKHNEIDAILVTAVSITVQIGSTIVLSGLGVPVPFSAAGGAFLSNLAGQGTAWLLGEQAPGHDGIDWADAGIAAAEGYAFSLAGGEGLHPLAARFLGSAGREVWQQNKTGFEGWTNWRGIAGSLSNVGSAVLDPELPGLRFGRYDVYDRTSVKSAYHFNFGLGGLINSALNPSSGWAVPGTGKTALVGSFEYAYSAVANGAASMAYAWIREQLDRPSPPALRGAQVARFAGDGSQDGRTQITSIDSNSPDGVVKWGEDDTSEINRDNRLWVRAVRTWWEKYETWELDQIHKVTDFSWDDAYRLRDALPDRVKDVLNSSDIDLALRAGDKYWLQELGYVEEKAGPLSLEKYREARDGRWDYGGVKSKFVPPTKCVYDPVLEGLIRNEDELAAQGLTASPGSTYAGTFEGSNPYIAGNVYYGYTKPQLDAAIASRAIQSTLANMDANRHAGPFGALVAGPVGALGAWAGGRDPAEGYASGVQLGGVGDAFVGTKADAVNMANATAAQPYRPEIVAAPEKQLPARATDLIPLPGELLGLNSTEHSVVFVTRSQLDTVSNSRDFVVAFGRSNSPYMDVAELNTGLTAINIQDRINMQRGVGLHFESSWQLEQVYQTTNRGHGGLYPMFSGHMTQDVLEGNAASTIHYDARGVDLTPPLRQFDARGVKLNLLERAPGFSRDDFHSSSELRQGITHIAATGPNERNVTIVIQHEQGISIIAPNSNRALGDPLPPRLAYRVPNIDPP